MKNAINRLVSLCICIALLLGVATTLGSCNYFDKIPSADEVLAVSEDERAFKLFDIVERQIDKADSYTMNMTTEATLPVADGISVSAHGTAVSYIKGQTAQDLCLYNEVNTTVTVTVGDEVIETQATSVTGYQDGNYYRKKTEDGKTTAIFSPLTRTEYFDHLEYMSDSFELDFSSDACITSTCVQNDDGTWSATYTDFFAEALDKLTAGIDDLAELLDGVKIKDAEVTLNVSEDFYADEMNVTFVFLSLNGAPPPTVTLNVEFSDYNETEAKSVDLAEYTELGDLRIIDKLAKATEVFTDRSSATYETAVTQRIIFGGETVTSTALYHGSFSNTESGFAHEMVCEDEASSSVIKYANGNLVVTIDGESIKTESTDAVQKALINSIILEGAVTDDTVSELRKSTEDLNKYYLTDYSPDTSRYDYLLEIAEAEAWETAEAEITVTLQGTRFLGYSYVLRLKTENNGFSLKVTVDSTME